MKSVQTARCMLRAKKSIFNGITFIETTAVPDGLVVVTSGEQMVVIDMRDSVEVSLPAPPGGSDA